MRESFKSFDVMSTFILVRTVIWRIPFKSWAVVERCFENKTFACVQTHAHAHLDTWEKTHTPTHTHIYPILVIESWVFLLKVSIRLRCIEHIYG